MYFLIYLIFGFTMLQFRYVFASTSGCEIINPSELKATGKESTNQSDIINALIDKHLFGESFTFHAPDHIDDVFRICDDALDVKDAAVVEFVKSSGKKYSLGSRQNTSVYGNINSANGADSVITMRFQNGDFGTFTKECAKKRMTSVVTIICDPEKSTGVLTKLYFDHDYCEVVFQLKLAAICGTLPGLSGWSIFFIILFVGFLVYFIAGFLYLKFKLHEQGINLIPNRLFWISIGNKLADGCGAVCRCDRFCGDANLDDVDSYSSAYSPIDGTNQQQQAFSSQSTNNDAALLQP